MICETKPERRKIIESQNYETFHLYIKIRQTSTRANPRNAKEETRATGIETMRQTKQRRRIKRLENDEPSTRDKKQPNLAITGKMNQGQKRRRK